MQQLNNGINVPALQEFSQIVSANPAEGRVTTEVLTTWMGGTRSRAHTSASTLGSKRLSREFSIDADEPEALLGMNTAPNPQELLMAAVNACMTVGYVANAAAMGIDVQSLSIRTTGTLDLRGFLGLDAAVNPGYDALHYDVEIKSTASREQLEALHDRVRQTSPNFHNLARAVPMHARLKIVEGPVA